MSTPHRSANGNRWRALRAKVMREEELCWLCGHWVDKTLVTPHPLSPEVDHVVPVAAGGPQYARENCRLAHRRCNRAKSDTIDVGMPADPVSRAW